jgi:hypothetical protein
VFLGDNEGIAMIRTTLFLVLLVLLAFFVSKTVRAQAECEDVYGLCMAGCANDRSAERCMQRCQGSRNRCSMSGSVAMQGAGFLRTDIPLDQSIRREHYDRPSRPKSNAR